MFILTKLFLMITTGILLTFILVLFDIQKLHLKHYVLYLVSFALLLFIDFTILLPTIILFPPLVYFIDYRKGAFNKLLTRLIFFAIGIYIFQMSISFVPFYYYSILPFTIILLSIGQKRLFLLFFKSSQKRH